MIGLRTIVWIGVSLAGIMSGPAAGAAAAERDEVSSTCGGGMTGMLYARYTIDRDGNTSFANRRPEAGGPIQRGRVSTNEARALFAGLETAGFASFRGPIGRVVPDGVSCELVLTHRRGKHAVEIRGPSMRDGRGADHEREMAIRSIEDQLQALVMRSVR